VQLSPLQRGCPDHSGPPQLRGSRAPEVIASRGAFPHRSVARSHRRFSPLEP
jgi:hypothetical protein